MTKQKTCYVTTAIPYVNAEPHIGFAMEVIEADTIVRWLRLQGKETFFLTGTDEHGVKIAKTAKEQGVDVEELCDKNSARYLELTKALHISNDDFIRTSDQKRHFPASQKLWKMMLEKGDIEKREYTALYCYGCEVFYTEKDLNEKGECPNHKRKPDLISEENYFFNFSKYSEQIAKLIESNALQIIPEFRKNEILQMAQSGFRDVPFSRPAEKLPWGIPVPDDDSQTIYVWCDALINYLSGIGFASSDESRFEKFWNKGEVTHVIGKDIVRFHAGIWIAMLLSAGIKIPERIFVHGFLTSEGHKMSKSLGNVVDPFQEVEKYGTDALRYFLLREVPIGRDADFSRQRFEENYQAHLANGLGNLASRVYKLCSDYQVFTLPGELFEDFAEILTKAETDLYTAMEEFSLHEGISAVFSVVEALDKKMDELKPWIAVKEDEREGKALLSNFLLALLWVARNVEPFLPETAEKLNKMFGEGKGKFGKGAMLFPRLEKLAEEQISGVKESSCFQNFEFIVSDHAKKAGVQADYVILENIAIKKSSKILQKFLKEQVQKWNTVGGKQSADWKKILDEQDDIKKNLGFDPKKFPSSPRLLADLAKKNGKLPNINNLVDIYNVIALITGVSFGAHDLQHFPDRKAWIDITKGDEEFTPLNSSKTEIVQSGEYAFFFAEKKIACRFESLQCDQTKITEKTKDALVYFQAPLSFGNDILEKAKTELLEITGKFL